MFDLIKTVKGKDISKVSNDLYQTRLRICGNCPHFNTTTKSCGTLLKGCPKLNEDECTEEEKQLCGCHIPTKATYADDACPLGKW